MDFLGNIVTESGYIVVPSAANYTYYLDKYSLPMFNAAIFNNYPNVSIDGSGNVSLSSQDKDKFLLTQSNVKNNLPVTLKREKMKKTILASSLLLLSVSLYAKPFVQCANNQCGLMDSEGFWIVEPQYKHIRYNPEGLSRFIEKDQFGYLDESGKVLIRPQESDIYRFAQNGLAKFKKNNKWGVTDKKFETIVPAK